MSSSVGSRQDLSGASINLSNLAYNSISEMIRSRQLRGGQVVVESRLADTLGISRTPMREALQRLEGEGLVVKGSGRSYLVRQVDLREYLHSLKVREILEPEAAALACGKIPQAALSQERYEVDQLRRALKRHTDAHWRSDDNLHGLYIDYCGNDVLANMVRQLRVTTRLFEIAKLADRVEQDAIEHLAILEALEADDNKAARKAVAAHIRSLSEFALDTVR